MPTATERAAVWESDKRKCVYCSEPLAFHAVEIDHIIAETTSESETRRLIADLHLPETFSINSVENWATCHSGCNKRKGAKNFDDPTSAYFLAQARRRAPQVRDRIKQLRELAKASTLLSQLAAGLETGRIHREEVLTVLDRIGPVMLERHEPWVIAFSVNLVDGVLPPGAPHSDPELSDWLLRRLLRDVDRTGATFHRLDDGRNGETISIRIAFWSVDLDSFDGGIDPCWEILYVQRYSDVFGYELPPWLDSENVPA